MQSQILCKNSKCKKLFVLDYELLKYRKPFKILDGSNDSVFITYCKCPHCGSTMFLQIDDNFSIMKYEEEKNIFTSLARKKLKEKVITQQQLERFKKSHKNLSSYRTKLMAKYTGKLAHNDETDEDVVIEFSV